MKAWLTEPVPTPRWLGLATGIFLLVGGILNLMAAFQ